MKKKLSDVHLVVGSAPVFSDLDGKVDPQNQTSLYATKIQNSL